MTTHHPQLKFDFAIDRRHVVLFCGSRNWTDKVAVAYAIEVFQPTLIVQGGARGADELARNYAEQRGIDFVTHNAEWDRYGKSAGPIRNMQMLDLESPDHVVAFSNDLLNSRGTSDMVQKSIAKGYPTWLISSDATSVYVRQFMPQPEELAVGWHTHFRVPRVNLILQLGMDTVAWSPE